MYEWQSVVAARYLAGHIELPSIGEQEKWEKDRITYKGDGVPFTALYPDFEDYFETLRKLAGDPTADRPGRKLPKFDKTWEEMFYAGHRRRIEMWKTANALARRNNGEVVAEKARL